MELVYLPTVTNKNQANVGKYTSPMNPIGIQNSIQDTHKDRSCKRYLQIKTRLVRIAFKKSCPWNLTAPAA